MSAEPIARVVRDIKEGRVVCIDNEPSSIDLNKDSALLAQWGTVIDATPVWERWMSGDGGHAVYEDHRICPPWNNAFVCYVNGFGNVTVMSMRALKYEDIQEHEFKRWESRADTHVIDWDRVHWVMHVVLYMGGRGGGEPVPTGGPMHCWRIAIYPDGEIADLNWIQTRPDLDVEMWDTAMMVLLDTFNLCNCVNVVVAEPARHRAAARRLSRTGVTVSEIHVRPVSRSYRGKGVPLSAVPSTPLNSVRGHFAEYGVNGKGKLFGKLTGRYWIPPHIRGSEAFGVIEHEYVTEP